MNFRFALPALTIAMLSAPGLAVAAGPHIDAAPMTGRDAPFDWNGFYAGVNGGYGYGRQGSNVSCDLTDPTCIISELSDGFNASGGFGGITAGYNFTTASSPFLVGLEADLDLANISGSIGTESLDDHGTPDPADDTLNRNVLSSKYNSVGSLRARVGVVNGPALMYVTGGLAGASITDSLNYSNNFGDTSSVGSSAISLGWTLGVGVEYALNDKATAKLEYQHIDLGSRTFATGDYWGNPTSQSTVSHALDVVKVGLNWHL